MSKLGRNIAAGFATVFLVAALPGCQKPEGPGERAGKEFDKAIDNAGKQIEKAGENIQDKARGDRR